MKDVNCLCDYDYFKVTDLIFYLIINQSIEVFDIKNRLNQITLVIFIKQPNN